MLKVRKSVSYVVVWGVLNVIPLTFYQTSSFMIIIDQICVTSPKKYTERRDFLFFSASGLIWPYFVFWRHLEMYFPHKLHKVFIDLLFHSCVACKWSKHSNELVQWVLQTAAHWFKHVFPALLAFSYFFFLCTQRNTRSRCTIITSQKYGTSVCIWRLTKSIWSGRSEHRWIGTTWSRVYSASQSMRLALFLYI